MDRLRQIIEENNSPEGRFFDIAIQSFIILSLISFSLETLSSIPQSSKRLLEHFEVLTVIIFTVEYLLRIIISRKKLKFIFSFFGLIDLCAILPFYIASGIDLRSIRTFRLLRLFRTFKLFRYNKAIQRFHQAFLFAKEELVLFFSIALLLIFFSAVGIYYCENKVQPEIFQSIFHSLWWAVATLTTVGYGDIYPITTGGKIFTSLILMVGLGIVAVPSGLVASALSEARRLEHNSKNK